jgi:hypothetical protein
MNSTSKDMAGSVVVDIKGRRVGKGDGLFV